MPQPIRYYVSSRYLQTLEDKYGSFFQKASTETLIVMLNIAAYHLAHRRIAFKVPILDEFTSCISYLAVKQEISESLMREIASVPSESLNEFVMFLSQAIRERESI